MGLVADTKRCWRVDSILKGRRFSALIQRLVKEKRRLAIHNLFPDSERSVRKLVDAYRSLAIPDGTVVNQETG
jgi:hypothetical protein